MSLGEKLCNARLAKKETTSEVAAATRMKVQTVEQLEREEFDKIPAPIYAKGFIKLYAEHVGLEAGPLVEEYVSRFSPGNTARLNADAQPHVQKLLKDGPETGSDEPPSEEEGDLFDHPAKPGGATASYQGERAPRMSLSDVWSHMADALRRGLQALAPAVRNSSGADEEPGKSFVFAALTKLSWRSVAIVAGVLVVLAFVASVATQCARDAEKETAPVPPPVEELRLAVEPPDPYID